MERFTQSGAGDSTGKGRAGEIQPGVFKNKYGESRTI